MSNSKPRYTGSITYVDDIQPAVHHGMILINGRKATLLDFDGGEKGRQIDVLRDVEVTEERDRVRVTGQSLFATRKIHLDEVDSQVEIIIDLTGKCKGCP